jgi:endo-1,4-beta-xylanase
VARQHEHAKLTSSDYFIPETMTISRLLGVVALALLIAACDAQSTERQDSSDDGDVPQLKEVFSDHFLIGAALNEDIFRGRDRTGADLAAQHFNSVTAENVMKWEVIHPQPNHYDFAAADAFVDFAERNGQQVVGHTLVWHSQTPAWVFEDENGDPATRDALIERMREHINTVAGRYRGRVHGWDVVNEALNEDGSLRQSPWYRIIGEDYLRLAFEFAAEADPDARLYYNDYSLENAPKRNGAVRLVRNLLDQGVRVDGIGTQGHYKMDWPTVEQIDSTIVAFAELGVDVMVTEIDIDVLPAATDDFGADVAMRAERRAEIDPYTDGLTDEAQQALAERYRDVFEVLVARSDAISRVTFWGVGDGSSWLNYWPVAGRTSHPLLFDREYRPKPAFGAVVSTAR